MPADDPTDTSERIRGSRIRAVKAFAKRPELAQRRSSAAARIVDGLTCEIKVGEWTLTADWPDVAGGNNRGPSPGDFQAASLAACLAGGIAGMFAELGIAHTGLAVEVIGSVDLRGGYGMESDAPMGYRQLSYAVRVESDAPEAKIMRAFDEAEAASSTLDNLRRPLEITRQVRISARSG